MSASKSLYEHDGIPVGPLKIIAVDGCQPLCETIDRYIVDWRRARRTSAMTPRTLRSITWTAIWWKRRNRVSVRARRKAS